MINFALHISWDIWRLMAQYRSLNFRTHQMQRGPNLCILQQLVESMKTSCFDSLFNLAPSTRPAPWPSTWPAKGWLGAIIAGWDNIGISAGWSPSWSPPALWPLNPFLPVGTDQWGAVAGGAASVSTRARLGRLRGKGPVRAGARRSHTVRADGAPGQGRG